MKVLEAQSATLSNWEVLEHLNKQRARYKARGKDGIVQSNEKEKGTQTRRNDRGPPNLETIVKELLEHFQKTPSPLADPKATYSKETMKSLITDLRPFRLTKAEILMILNHRPASLAHLDILVEELSSRVAEDDQQLILDIIKINLGGSGGETDNSTTNGTTLKNEPTTQNERNNVKMEY